MGLVSEKCALVTGAGAGIGRATAIKFAEEGARVALADIDDDGGRETLSIIEKAGGDAFFLRTDVSIRADVEKLIHETLANFGRIDCACNNAGVEGKIAPLCEQSDDNFDRIIAINLKGVFQCMRSEIPAMIKHGAGSIVNISSVAGLIGFPGLSPYVASKHAVAGLTKNAALEYGKQGIRVNAVCPGGIDTRMLQSVAEQSSGVGKTHELFDPLHPIGRIGEPEEVAELIVWLSSSRASFVTGAVIPVDGGFVAQ